LLGVKLATQEDLRWAAQAIQKKFGCAALVKGGHVAGAKKAVDVFYDGHCELLLSAPFVRGIKTHGTGCAYSAAITAGLARGLSLSQAVSRGKAFITKAIVQSCKVGQHDILSL